MPSPLESLYFKIWITTVILLWSFQALQGKNFKGSLKTDSELIAILKIKPGQKLCRNCIKKATEVTEHCAEETEICDDTEEEYHCSHTSNLTLNESASLLGISPIKSAGKRDRIGYGKQKVKHFKESTTDLVATACDFKPNIPKVHRHGQID